MATYQPEVIDLDGLAATYRAAASGDQLPPGDGVFLHVKNGNGASCTVTLVTPELVDADLAVPDRTVTVPATTGERFIAVPSRYADAATGLATVNFSVTATVTYAVVRI